MGTVYIHAFVFIQPAWWITQTMLAIMYPCKISITLLQIRNGYIKKSIFIFTQNKWILERWIYKWAIRIDYWAECRGVKCGVFSIFSTHSWDLLSLMIQFPCTLMIRRHKYLWWSTTNDLSIRCNSEKVMKNRQLTVHYVQPPLTSKYLQLVWNRK